jgi:hypothetical protein
MQITFLTFQVKHKPINNIQTPKTVFFAQNKPFCYFGGQIFLKYE